MRIAALLGCLILTACGPSAPHAPVSADPTADPSYARTIGELKEINRAARESFGKGQADLAAHMIQTGEPLSKRLMSVPRPTLGATEAASDLDQLYGDMLLSNRNYGWARMFYQKNLARWKYWRPETPESARLMKQAEDSIARCDSGIGAGRATPVPAAR
jgi:hypothetical protein